jgi:hypothetical protein
VAVCGAVGVVAVHVHWTVAIEVQTGDCLANTVARTVHSVHSLVAATAVGMFAPAMEEAIARLADSL